jgi:spore coat protein H
MSPRHERAVVLLAIAAFAEVGCVSYEDSAAVFDRTKLHIVEITVDPSDLTTLESDLERRVPCSVSYDGEAVEEAGIRQKGKLQALSGSPSFNIKIDEFDEAASLHGLTKLLLNSGRHDESFLREMIAADMHARAGLPAARVAHAAVRFNGSDLGIYVVVEAVTKDFLADRFGGDGDGNLYEAPCCGDFVDDTDLMVLDDEEDDVRSRDDIEALAEVIKSTLDEALAEELDELLDFKSFVTGYALDAALGHWDGYSYGVNNYSMYNNPDDGRFVFLAHGMDRALTDPESEEGWALFDPETAPKARLPLRIRGIPALSALFDDELSRVVTDVWSEGAVLATIDQAAQVIRSAGAGERTRADVAMFEERLEGARSVVKERRAFLAQ